MSHPLSFYKRYWSHSTFVAHYHCISARFLSALVVQIKNMDRALWALHTVYIIFTQTQPPPHQTTFVCMCFFSCKHTLALYRMTCFAFLDTLKPWVWHEIFYARKPLLIIILNAPKLTHIWMSHSNDSAVPNTLVKLDIKWFLSATKTIGEEYQTQGGAREGQGATFNFCTNWINECNTEQIR